MNTQIDEILLKRLKSMRKQQLTLMLRCNICEGLFRFAHTIVDCGHTFCQICIFNYIRGFKGRNPAIKCPQCHILVESNYKRSIIRDIFKQSLVDTLAPEYAKEDQIIAKRVQQLFPQFDLEFLFEEFKFVTFQMPAKMTKKDSESNISSLLMEKIKQKFSISFQTFCQMIVNEDNFVNFLTIIQNAPQPKIIQIKAKTERDFNFVGLNNQLKATNLTVIKVQRFVQKKALEKINKTEQCPAEWVNTQDQSKLDIKIYLLLNGKYLEPTDNLEVLLLKNKGCPVLYTLRKTQQQSQK